VGQRQWSYVSLIPDAGHRITTEFRLGFMALAAGSSERHREGDRSELSLPIMISASNRVPDEDLYLIQVYAVQV